MAECCFIDDEGCKQPPSHFFLNRKKYCLSLCKFHAFLIVFKYDSNPEIRPDIEEISEEEFNIRKTLYD